MSTPEEMLDNRFSTELEWSDPWPAVGPEGNTLDTRVTLRATVHDCVNISRAAARRKGKSTMENDKRFLLDFIDSVEFVIEVLEPEWADNLYYYIGNGTYRITGKEYGGPLSFMVGQG